MSPSRPERRKARHIDVAPGKTARRLTAEVSLSWFITQSMPIHYEVDHPRRRVSVLWQPPVSLQELLEIADRQASDGAWSYGILADARGVSALPPDVGQPLIAHISQLSQTHGRRGPVALVVMPSSVGMAQKYAYLGEFAGTQDTQVFWDRGDAVVWLDSIGQRTD